MPETEMNPSETETTETEVTGAVGKDIQSALMDMIIADESPSNISDTIKDMLYTKSAETNLELTDGLSLPHENNPTLTVTDDRSTTSRTERQNLEALVVPSGSFAKAILTVDAAGALRGYAGEVVTTSLASAKFPVLDLDDECPFWAMEITGAYTAGTTAWATNNTNYALVGMP